MGPVHTIFHLGSIGTGSRKTPSGPRFHARLESQSGQIYRCEHNHRTESAAVKCANSKAAQAAAAQAKADRKAAAQAQQGPAHVRLTGSGLGMSAEQSAATMGGQLSTQNGSASDSYNSMKWFEPRPQ